MATQQLVAPAPAPSCRTDWGTFTYKTPKKDQIEELGDYFRGLAHHLLPNGSWSAPRAGRHFTHVTEHDSGITLEFTPEGTGNRNAGLFAVSLPGQIWGALNGTDRLTLIEDLGVLPGYYRCTRWDAQITVLDPPISVEEFVRRAEEKSIWAVRYGEGQPYGRKNMHNEWVTPPSFYFGSTTSSVRARIYDHGVKWDWPMPSLRFELQFRKQWANDHFNRLQRTASHELAQQAGDLQAEQLCVKAALKQHLKLKDTSKWVGKRLPKNWASQAPELGWYEEMVDQALDTLKATHRPAATWQRAQELAVQQYGRKAAKQMILDSYQQGSHFTDQAVLFAARMAATMQPEDLLELKEVIPPEEWDSLRHQFHVLTGEVAEIIDEAEAEKGAKPPRG